MSLILLFGAVVYVVVSDIFVQESVAKTEMAIEKAAVEISADIRHAKSLLRLLTTTDAFTAYAADSQAGAEELMKLMSAITDSDFYVFGVFAAFEDGRIVSENSATTLGETEYETLLSYDMPFLTTARTGIYAHEDSCVITMGVPIEMKDSAPRGVLALDMDYCMIGNTVASIALNGTVYITDAAGDVIFQTDGETLPENLTLGYDAGSNVLVQRYPIAGTDWFLTGRTRLRGLDVLKRQLLDIIALTGVLLFFSLFLIAFYYSRRLTTPIARLAGSMEDIERLTELAVLADEISETQALTESYNRMIRKIKQLMAQLEQKQLKLRQTEIDALTQQINPHFLYNTLDTIVWLAEFRDMEKIIALTKSLAAFFRLSLGGGQAVVPLADEIAHVQQYLYIQKERYGEKLTYTFDVENKVLDCMVPKILLQPIVENSIYHGIKPMDGIGHIAITARQAGDDLLITVQDNGVGFDGAKAAAQPDGKKNNGVGLHNVENRIKLYYGEDCGVDITSAPGEGTTVRLRLKMHLPEDGIMG